MGCERNFPLFVLITEYPFFFFLLGSSSRGIAIALCWNPCFFFAIYLQVVGNGWIDFGLIFGNVMMEGVEEGWRRKVRGGGLKRVRGK